MKSTKIASGIATMGVSGSETELQDVATTGGSRKRCRAPDESTDVFDVAQVLAKRMAYESASTMPFRELTKEFIRERQEAYSIRNNFSGRECDFLFGLDG